MEKVNIPAGSEEIESIDDFLRIYANDSSDDGDGSSFTAKVVSDSMDRLFPDEERIRKLMMVSNLTNFQLNHILKSLHSAYVMGLCKEKMGHASVYEYRLQIVEDFLRMRVSINSRGRKDIVDSLKAIMLNELQGESSRLKRLLGKG